MYAFPDQIALPAASLCQTAPAASAAMVWPSSTGLVHDDVEACSRRCPRCGGGVLQPEHEDCATSAQAR